jgi:signal transduction histidine kinase/ligand-binding sensor domain-containing protein/DNA-binding response OmpR family regulator
MLENFTGPLYLSHALLFDLLFPSAAMKRATHHQDTNLSALALRPSFLVVSCLILSLPANLYPANDTVNKSTQDLVFQSDHIGLKDGLPTGFVWAIAKDRQGFMWFATANGLCRYDGNEVKVYLHDPKDLSSLPSNAISKIEVDADGYIWMKSYLSWLVRFDPATENSDRFQHGDNKISALKVGREGDVWIGCTGYGLQHLPKGSNEFIPYPADSWNMQRPQDPRPTSLYEDRRGNLWIGSESGSLNRYDRETGIFERYPSVAGLNAGRSGTEIHTILEDSEGLIWVGTAAGIVIVNPQTKQARAALETRELLGEGKSASLTTLSVDNTGRFWVSFQGGELSWIEPKTMTHKLIGKWEHEGDVLSVYADTIGDQTLLWIGTGLGVEKINVLPSPFNFLSPGCQGKPLVSTVLQDRAGVIWFGSPLQRLDPKTGECRVVTTLARGARISESIYVYLLHEDREGNIWIGSTNQGLHVMNERTGLHKAYLTTSINSSDPGGEWISSIYEDSKGIMWVSVLDSGVYRFDRASDGFVQCLTNELNSATSRSIVEGMNNTMWIGTGTGLIRFDSETGRSTTFLNDPADPSSLSNNFVFSLVVDQSGTVWVGTGDGLNRINTDEGTFTTYRYSQRIPSKIIGMVVDNDGNIWCHLDIGLARFNPRLERFKLFDETDGLPRRALEDVRKSEKGDILLCYPNRLIVRFRPEDIRSNTHSPPVVLTSISVREEPLRVRGSTSHLRNIVLDYDQNHLSFTFAALDYKNPKKNEYAYSMEGVDEGWVYSGNRRYVSYTNLDPGEYILRVKGSNNDGVWNEEGTSLRIIITPPWWRTTWAYIGYALVFAFTFYGIRRYEMNRIRLRHQLQIEQVSAKKLKEIDEMKSRFFANISHEFRTPLTLILGPLKDLRQQVTGDGIQQMVSTMERNANRLLRLINQLLDLSKLEAGRMKLQVAAGNIVPFIKGIAHSFHSSAGRRGVTFSVECAEEAMEGYFDRDKVEKILTNLISNAFKFTGEGGEVLVSLRATTGSEAISSSDGQIASVATLPRNDKAGFVAITVTDTGIGISPDHLPHIFDRFYQVTHKKTTGEEGTGIGLALTKELVELHHGTISVESEVGKGTTFAISLPIGKEAYSAEEIAEHVEESQAENEATPELEFAESDKRPATIPDEHSQHILVIEDNADVRAYISQYLVVQYKVSEAKDGTEGIYMARTQIPDLIISDVMMPRADGFEVCKTLKLDEKTSHIPIILLTAKAGMENKIEGLETGADDYLVKPFDSQELLARVKNLIELRRKLRERYGVQILKPGEVAVRSLDDQFLRKVTSAVEEHMSEEEFSVEQLAAEVAMSRSQLHRKLVALTGQTPTDLIRYLRLHRAKDLLMRNAGTVAEVAFQVGFSDPGYLTKCYKELFGVLPSEVRRRQT